MSPDQQKNTEAFQVTRGAFVNLVGNLGKFSFLGFDLVATRMLGQEIFGYYSTAWLILNLAFIVCYFGAHRLVIDFVAASRARDDESYYGAIVGCILLSFALSLLLVAGVFIFAGEIAIFFNKPPLAEYLKIISLSAPFYCLTTILLSATRGLKIMRAWVLVRQGLEPFLDFVVILLLVLVWGLSTAPFIARAFVFFIGSIFSIWIFASYFDLAKLVRSFPTSADWRRIAAFGFPVMLSDFLFNVMLRLDIIPLSILVPATQVAVFQIVLNIGNVMRNIPMAVDPIMMPIVVEMRHRGDGAALDEIYRTLIRISTYLCAGFFTLMALTGDLVLSLYGGDFVAGTGVLIMVVGALAINTIFSGIEPVLVMSGYPYINLMNSIFFVSVNLIVDFALIPAYGLIGAGIGCLAASILTSVVQVLEFYLLLKIRPLSLSLLKPLLIAGVTLSMVIAADGSLELSPLFRVIAAVLAVTVYFMAGWRYFFKNPERRLLAGIFHIKGKSSGKAD